MGAGPRVLAVAVAVAEGEGMDQPRWEWVFWGQSGLIGGRIVAKNREADHVLSVGGRGMTARPANQRKPGVRGMNTD
jgi:hypothetical protein